MPLKYFTFLLAVFWSALTLGEKTSSYNGVWEIEGYGYIFNIQNTSVTIYEKTSKSCLISGLSSGELTHPESKASPYFEVTIPGFIKANMELYQGSYPNGLGFHRTDTNTLMIARRLSRLPEQCLIPPDPALAMDVFIQNFREHYPFLLRNPEFLEEVNFDRSKIVGQVLFDKMAKLLIALDDPHTALLAPDINQLFLGNELPNPRIPSASELAKLRQKIEEHYIVGPMNSLNEQMWLGQLSDGLSYLAIDGFWGLSKEGSAKSDRWAMHLAIQEILAALKESKGLIIDLRSHSGGSDALGIQLAAIFTKREYLAFKKQFVIKGGPEPRWKEGAPITVSPAGPNFWGGQIVALTGPATVSAGEAFVMALDQRQPEVTRVGDKTRGSFSDMLPRTLPNGWLFSLPNERYLDAEGKSFDFVGIEPDVYVKEEESDSEHKSQDKALDVAMRLLLGTEPTQ